MIKKYIFRQSGLTLTEVLAVLAISTIIIGLVSTALVTAIKYNNTTQSHIDLRQEANLIVTKLRSLHQGESYNLCYDNGEIYLDSEKNDSLAPETITLKGIENGEDKRILLENASNTLSESDTESCLFQIDTTKPLLVTLTLVDETNKKFEIDTAIDRLNAYKPSESTTDIDDDDGNNDDGNGNGN